jgi:hypothetical protein
VAKLHEDAIDFHRRDDRFVRAEASLAPFGQQSLELCEFLRAVGVVLERGFRGVEEAEEGVVAVLFDLIHGAVQVDADDSLHACYLVTALP